MKKSLPLIFVLKQYPVALVVFCAIAVAAAYLQALHYPFILDDITYISKNSRLAELHLTELWRLFTEPYNDMAEFLPMRELSYWLDISLFGLNPAAFRLHNIFLYLLCLPLVYGCTLEMWRYFRSDDAASAPWAAAVVTVLFVLNPSHAEAVVWIAGRKDVLSGMFSLLALWLALNAKSERGLSPPYAVATLVALLAAMLSKATAVAVAPLIAMIWVLYWREMPESKKCRLLLLWPLAALLLAGCFALIFASIATTKVPFYFGIEAVTRTLAVLGWLVRVAVSPESRHFFYPVFDDPYLPVMVALGVSTLAAAAAGGAVLLRRRSLTGFTLVAFLLTCLPSIQLMPYAPPSLVSDRFVFLAVWPVILLLVSLSWRLKPAPRVVLLLTIALPWGFQTVERPRDWRSWGAVVEIDSRAYPGHYPPAAYKIVPQMDDGLIRDAAETALRINDPVARNIMLRLINADNVLRQQAVDGGNPYIAADVLKELGYALKKTPDKALWDTPMYAFWKSCRTMYIRQWIYLLKHFPGDMQLRYYAGLSSLDVEEYRGADAFLRVAAESRQLPDQMRGSAFYGYGFALMKKGNIAEAEASLRSALEQTPPDMRAYCALAKVYGKTGRNTEALQAEAECHSRVPSVEARQ